MQMTRGKVNKIFKRESTSFVPVVGCNTACAYTRGAGVHRHGWEC